MMAGKNKITVTRTVLPPLKDYVKHLEKIWENNHITNHGPLVTGLERKLKKYLGVKNLFFVSNGTAALEIAIKSLGLTGEIITTPFSYIATSSSIAWMNCKPVFADIDPGTLNISPEKLKKALTPKTTGILATHVYGNPCDVESIENIAKENGLKVIYDAAHCFGVEYKNIPLLNYGDVSTISFHATKIFHTAEGGALAANNKEIAHKIEYMRNFGHKGEEAFWGLGINGKNSELHAAMGLTLLPHIKKIILTRKKLSNLYDKLLFSGLSPLRKPVLRKNTKYNYSYYPVIFESETVLLRVREALNKKNIFPRRYFYPSLNILRYLGKSAAPAAEKTSKRILCLPLYVQLKDTEVKQISKIVLDNL